MLTNGFDFGNALLESEANVTDYDDGNIIDTVLSDNDLEAMFNKACPITGDLTAVMKENAANPDNVPVFESNGQYYINYSDFANFCENSSNKVNKAIAIIAEANTIDANDINIVFPSFTALKEGCACVGYHDIGYSTKYFSDCINNGIKVTTFKDPAVDKEPVKYK